MKSWILFAGLLTLAGCASLGGNVRGDFTCRAPQGTCAPTAEIDAQAVDKAVRAQGESPRAPGPIGARATQWPQGDELVRTGERVLRIVFLPYIDEAGHFHESAAVHAVVEGAGWQAMPAEAPPVPAPGEGEAAEPAVRQVELPAGAPGPSAGPEAGHRGGRL